MSASSQFPPVLLGITTRNRAEVLPKAIASAQEQDYPAIHLAVIDDASTDSTPTLRARFPGVDWIRRDRAWGYMSNRNELMARSGFRYFLSLDDDAWFLQRDEVAIAIAYLEANPAVAAVAFDILSPDRPTPNDRGTPRRVAMFIGCGHLVRIAAVRAAGFYASTPGTYGSEEKDLCLRLADRGHEVHFLPGVHVWHDKAWSGRDWFPLHRSGVCNELVMTLRRCPMPDVFAVLPLKVASYLGYWLRQPKYFRAGLAGLRDFVVNLPAVWATRQPVRRDTFWRFVRTTR